MNSSDAIRKAAILINSLDRQSADALLEQMDEAKAVAVRRMVLELDRVDPGEQDQVIAEFLQISPPTAGNEPSGVELDESLVRRLAVGENRETGKSPAAPSPQSQRPDCVAETPFQFLHEAAGGPLARLLAREHPQTVALVLSHLPAARAAEVLNKLPAELQVQVIRRVVALEATSPDIVSDIAQELRSVLASEPSLAGPSQTGLAAMKAILANADLAERGDILNNLTRHDRSLAAFLQGAEGQADRQERQINDERQALVPAWAKRTQASPHDMPAPAQESRSPSSVAWDNEELLVRGFVGQTTEQEHVQLDFEELTKFDNRSLGLVLQTAESQMVLLALAGAKEDLVRRILKPLSRSQAELLRRQIEQQGPIRLRDVERAQQAVARVAQNLIDQGQIPRPPRRRFAIAA